MVDENQPYAIQTLLSWIVLGPVDQASSSVRNINHTEAKVDSLTKQVDLLHNDEFNDDEYLRTAASIEN